VPEASSNLHAGRLHAILLAALLWLPCGLAHAQATGEEPVALVTESTGKAQTRVGDQTVAVALLSEFASGARVRLYQGARMLVLFYGTAELYALTGPSLVRITETRIEALSGNEAVKQQTLGGRDGKPLLLRAGGITQAGIVVRGVARPIAALSMTGGVTLDARPVFRWREPEVGLDYRFVLRDGTETIIYERTLRETTLTLPLEVALNEAQRYRWSVSAKSPAGIDYAVGYRFVLANGQIRHDMANFQPDAQAGTAQRIAYALWLEQTGLRDEARGYWDSLVADGVPIPVQKPRQ